MSKIIISFLLFSLFPAYCLANFEIREPCASDADIENNRGVKLKFYASLLAYNSEKPRCILTKPVIASYQVEEAITHNDPRTNDIIVDIILTESGKKKFSDYSRQTTENEIAFIIEDKILAMLTLPEPIVDGKIQIRGLWYEDAIRLSNAINQK